MNRHIKLSSLLLALTVLMLPVSKTGQTIAHPHIDLMDLYGTHLSFEEIIDVEGKTMVVFWNSNNKQHIDFLSELDEKHGELLADGAMNLVAICTNKYHNYQQLQTLASAKHWKIDLYVDVNESFKRVNGVSDEHLGTLFYAEGQPMDSDEIVLPLVVNHNFLVLN